MRRNRSSVFATLTVALVLVAARRTPSHSFAQATDACWLQGKTSELALRASPHDSASIAMDGGTVKVCYGRPRQIGRPIMGSLVPYGEPWRLGANEATAIRVPFRARIAGVSVEPGWYSIYAIPAAKQWQIVVNSQAQRWGIPIDAAVRAKNVGTGTVPSEHVTPLVEALTITLNAASPTRATMNIEWADTRVKVPIERQ